MQMEFPPHSRHLNEQIILFTNRSYREDIFHPHSQPQLQHNRRGWLFIVDKISSKMSISMFLLIISRALPDWTCGTQARDEVEPIEIRFKPQLCQ